MGNVLQVTTVWSGFTGAPGFTNLYFRESGLIQTAVDNAVAAVDAFFGDLEPWEGNDVTWTIDAQVKSFDEATGALQAIYSPSSAPAARVGDMNDLGPIPAGVCIAWGTSGINRGRPVRGRTFIVPLGYLTWEGDGTPAASAMTAIRNAATDMRNDSGSELVVWSRPRAGAGGAAFPVTSSNVRDVAAVLRSRRD